MKIKKIYKYLEVKSMQMRVEDLELSMESIELLVKTL